MFARVTSSSNDVICSNKSYLLTHSLIISKPCSGPATTPTQRLVITRIQMTVWVQQMDIPEHGCRESRRESRMGGQALNSLCSEISHDHR